MKEKRPIFLDVTKYKFPNTAIVSILHRISGIILFLFLPFLIWALDKSLSSGEHFQELLQSLEYPLVKLIVWLLLVSLIFHLIAGIRHILMDMGIGETHYGGRLGANLVLIISLLLALTVGVWVC